MPVRGGFRIPPEHIVPVARQAVVVSTSLRSIQNSDYPRALGRSELHSWTRGHRGQVMSCGTPRSSGLSLWAGEASGLPSSWPQARRDFVIQPSQGGSSAQFTTGTELLTDKIESMDSKPNLRIHSIFTRRHNNGFQGTSSLTKAQTSISSDSNVRSRKETLLLLANSFTSFLRAVVKNLHQISSTISLHRVTSTVYLIHALLLAQRKRITNRREFFLKRLIISFI